jgi:hypothetical protein
LYGAFVDRITKPTPEGVSYLFGRVVPGVFLAPLGFSAAIGDVTYGVEQGVRDPAELIILGITGND